MKNEKTLAKKTPAKKVSVKKLGSTGKSGVSGVEIDTLPIVNKIKRNDYPVLIEYKREVNSTLMNMFFSYFNKMLNEPAMATADGINIFAVLSDESKFIDNLP